MKFNQILGIAAKTFAAMKMGGRKTDPKLAALDRGVLTVGLLLAALDGTILPDEFAAFQTLAEKCRGGSAKNVRALLDAALPSAGLLIAMAQVGVYTEQERLAAFRAAAEKALPSGFTDGVLLDVRRAFALWVAVGVSDGTFSPLERAAVELLADFYADVRCQRTNMLMSCVDIGVSVCPGAITPPPLVKKTPLLEPDFLAKAEKIARALASPAKQEQAEADLAALIHA